MLDGGLFLHGAERKSVVDKGDEPPRAAGLPKLWPVGVEAERGDLRPEATPPLLEPVGAQHVPRVGQQVEDAHQQVNAEVTEKVDVEWNNPHGDTAARDAMQLG